MITSVHAVFLVFLAAAFVWNLRAARVDIDVEAGTTRLGRLELLLLVPQLICLVVMVRDRLEPFDAPWALRFAWLFPATFALGVVQNVVAIAKRGARPTDVPLVLYNVGVGALVGVATLAARGDALSGEEAVLLYDYSVLQMLLGGRMTYVATLSWHLPLFAMRSAARSVPQLGLRLVMPAVAAFAVTVVVANHASSGVVLRSFAREPAATSVDAWRDDLVGGVWFDPTAGDARPPGTHAAWVLPADHPGTGLPTPDRPLVVALRAPDGWALAHPTDVEALQTFLDGAERLAGALRPDVLLPFPDPDRDALETAGVRRSPREWATLYAEARRRVRAASPATRTACRLSTSQSFARRLFAALVDEEAVDIAGPYLQPGGPPVGAGWADVTLDAWSEWRTAAGNRSPELWILGAGASHMAFGRVAQERFVEGCVARAQRRTRVTGIVFDGWRDVGHTRGLAASRDAVRHIASIPGWAAR